MSMKQHRQPPQGPAYRFSGRYIGWCFVLAWAVIVAIVIGGLLGSENAARLADIIVPSMVALIVALLGVHRAFGSLDFLSVHKHKHLQPLQPDPAASGF